MALANTVINAMIGGEISPKMYGRTDLAIRQQSLKTLTNMRVRPQGGADRRNGTKFIAETKDSSAKSRLMDFDSSDESSYVLELGNLYARVYTNLDQVREAAKTISAITKANPAVVTATSHGYTNGDHVWITSVAGMTQVNNRRFTVAGVTTHTFQLSGINSSSYSTYTSGGSSAKVFEFATPFATASLFNIQKAQDQSQMFLTEGTYPTQILTRTSDTSWTIGNADFVDGPYLPANQPTTTLTPSGTSGSVTITASTAIFLATDTSGTNGTGAYDRLIRFNDAGGTWHWMKITAFTDTTHVTASIIGTTLSATTGQTTWRLGAFSNTTGYPKAVFIAEQRLVLAGASGTPQTYFYSAVGSENYLNMSPDDASVDDATSYTVAAKRANPIRWISSLDNDLLSGTSRGEWRRTGAITPGDAAIRPISYEGSALVQPVETSKSIAFVQQTRGRLIAISVNRLGAAGTTPLYETADLTFAADHLSGTGFVELAYSQNPYRSVIAVCNDGTMTHTTYDEKYGVLAWSKWVTDGLYESVESIPVASTGIEETSAVWTIVKRTINGAVVRYVEMEDPTLNTDCAMSFAGSATLSPGALWHLEAETVTVKVDAAVVESELVANGDITLAATGTAIEAGMPFSHTIVTLPQIPNISRGSSLGVKSRTHQVSLLLRESLGSSINGDDILYRESGDLMGSAPDAFTGTYTVTLNSSWSRDGEITITGNQPYDFSLNAIVIAGNFSQA